MKKEIEHKERAHALLSASGAERWMNCTPSPRLEEKLGIEDETSVFAEEGTLAHELAEAEIRMKFKMITPAQYKKKIKEIEADPLYSADMDTFVAYYVDFVREQFAEAKKRDAGAVLMVEEKYNLEPYVPEGFGTGDASVIADGVLDIIDLKYGKGLEVSAVDNKQLKLYALGALRKYDLVYDVHTVRLSIIQPRLDNFSTWEISVEELTQWAVNEVIPKAKAAHDGKVETKAGEWCRWCKVAPKCRAIAEKAVEVAKHEFKDPNLLDDAEVLEIYENSAFFSKWFDNVKAYVLNEAKAGKKWDGYKLVEGKSNRKINSPEKAAAILKGLNYKDDEYMKSSLKGLGDLEKLLTKKVFNEKLGALIVKPQGAPTLAPVSDKRPEFGIESAKKDFE